MFIMLQFVPVFSFTIFRDVSSIHNSITFLIVNFNSITCESMYHKNMNKILLHGAIFFVIVT